MRYLLVSAEDEALLALRRTLWQLAVVGSMAAIAIAWLAPAAHAAALWCVLAPLSALTVHYREGAPSILRR